MSLCERKNGLLLVGWWLVVSGVSVIDSTSVAHNGSCSGFSFVMGMVFLAAFVTSFCVSCSHGAASSFSVALKPTIEMQRNRVVSSNIGSSIVLHERSKIHLMQDVSRLSQEGMQLWQICPVVILMSVWMGTA